MLPGTLSNAEDGGQSEPLAQAREEAKEEAKEEPGLGDMLDADEAAANERLIAQLMQEDLNQPEPAENVRQ